MTNAPHPDYPRVLPWLLLAALPAYLMLVFFNYPGNPMEERDGYFWRLVMGFAHALPLGAALWLAGQQVGQPAAGKTAIAALLLGIPILVHPQMPPSQGSYIGWLGHTLLKGLPMVLWGWRIFGTRGFAPFLGFFLWTPAFFALSTGASAFFNVELFRWKVPLEGNHYTYIYWLPHVFVLFLPILVYVLLLFVWQYTRQGWYYFHSMAISLERRVPKLAALVLFIAFKWIIFQSALGMSSIRMFLSNGKGRVPDSTWAALGHTMWIDFAVSMLLLLWVLYWFRKFLLEFFFQLGLAPSYWFWGLQIPVLDVFLFVLLLGLVPEKTAPVPEETFQKSQDPALHNTNLLRSLLLLAQLAGGIPLLLVLQKMNNAPGILSMLISMSLSIYYLYHYKAWRWLVAVLVLQLIGTVWIGEDPAAQGAMSRMFFFDGYFLSVMSFTVAFMLSGVIHIRSFHLEGAMPAGVSNENTPLDVF